MKCLYKGLGMWENINKWKLSLSDKISCGLVLSKCYTLSSVHTTACYSLPLILYRTHTWLNITVAKSQQFPTAITQKVLPPWAATAEPRNVGRQGTVFHYYPAHFLTMCPFSSSIIINDFTRDMGIYQSAALGVSAGSSLWLVIKIGLFRLSFSQLVIFLLIDGLLLAGSILDRQHKVSHSSGQFRGPGCLYNCPHFITVESEPKSDALTLSHMGKIKIQSGVHFFPLSATSFYNWT